MTIQRAMRDVQSRFQPAARPTLFEGAVHQAPGATDETMSIVCDSFGDGLHYFDPVSWPERGDLLPSVGDRVWFSFSNKSDTVVLAWWPYD